VVLWLLILTKSVQEAICTLHGMKRTCQHVYSSVGPTLPVTHPNVNRSRYSLPCHHQPPYHIESTYAQVARPPYRLSTTLRKSGRESSAASSTGWQRGAKSGCHTGSEAAAAAVAPCCRATAAAKAGDGSPVNATYPAACDRVRGDRLDAYVMVVVCVCVCVCEGGGNVGLDKHSHAL
jgi:hypothetical protein